MHQKGRRLCGRFIGAPERMKTMWRVYRRTRKVEDYVEVYRRTRKDEDYINYKQHLMQLRLKLDNLKEAMGKNYVHVA